VFDFGWQIRTRTGTRGADVRGRRLVADIAKQLGAWTSVFGHGG
jgi:hypothetical protein